MLRQMSLILLALTIRLLPAQSHPARPIDDVTRMMQRAILDRPVVDKTGLVGRYDFNLEWAPDNSQFGGENVTDAGTNSPPLLLAMEQQLGLKLTRTRGSVSTLIVDHLDRPSEN